MTCSPTDAAIVAQVCEGNTEAYSQLVDRYRNIVYGVAYHHLHNFADAQDVAQEVFVQAYRHLHRLRDPSKFAPWLRQITTNQCLMWQRRQEKTESLDDSFPASNAVSQVESRLAIEQALDCLSEDTRLTLTLFYFKEYSTREIAAFLEVPISTIKSRLRDARARLRKEMWEMMEETMRVNTLPDDFTAKVGKVIQTHETFVTVQFDSDSTPELFTAWKASNPALQDSCLLVVAQHLDDGKVRCITLPPTYKVPGLDAVQSHESFDLDIQSEGGGTALSYAVVHKATEIVRALLDKGADVNLTTDLRVSNLVFAAMYNHLDIAVLLMERGADVNLMPEFQNSTLMYAAFHGNAELVKALLEKGADASHQTPSGKTAQIIAQEKAQTYLEVAELLKQAEAKE